MPLLKNILRLTPVIHPIFSVNVYKYIGISSTVVINQTRNYAARKGTRDRKKKQKVKVEEKKVGFIAHNERDREKALLLRPKRRIDDSWKQLPTDDVYPQKYYQWRMYNFEEAVKCHRETHHPDVYNQPNANLHVTIELDMTGEKKTRYVDNFNRIIPIKYKFDHGEERRIIAFTKDKSIAEEALKAGAEIAGGSEIIKLVQNGNVSLHDYQFIFAHPDMLPEMVVLRGLMKKKFPNVRNGTLEVDLGKAVDDFKHGIRYVAHKDEYEKDFAAIETVIGTLNMDPKHLEDNFATLLNSVYGFKPRRSGPFITKCILWSPPSREKLKIDHSSYLKAVEEKPRRKVEEDNEELKQVQSEAVA